MIDISTYLQCASFILNWLRVKSFLHLIFWWLTDFQNSRNVFQLLKAQETGARALQVWQTFSSENLWGISTWSDLIFELWRHNSYLPFGCHKGILLFLFSRPTALATTTSPPHPRPIYFSTVPGPNYFFTAPNYGISFSGCLVMELLFHAPSIKN